MPKRLSAPKRCTAKVSDDPLVVAAHLIVTAARSLVIDPTIEIDASRCHAAANSLAAALARPHATPADILEASPFVNEQSGNMRTLIDMIVNEDGDGPSKLRMARLLLRALDWR